MKITRICLAMVLISLTFISSNIFGEQGKEKRPPREKWNHVEIQATVQEIDLEKREVTLMGPHGNLVTVIVDDRVKRLNEVKKGDVVSAKYWSYMMAEFRDPTPDELKVPLVLLAEGGKAPEGMDPSAEVGAVVQAVVTIEIINRPNMEVTVMGPQGNFLTIPVADPDLIKQLNVGEAVVLTYAEALVLSLEKIK